MARYDETLKVAVPKNTIIYTIGGKKYAYYTLKKVYIKNKKSNSDKRVPVGKITEEDTTMMYPNSNFRLYFKDEYEKLKIPEIESDKLNFSDCIRYGLNGVFFNIAKQLNLFKLIENSLDDEEVDIEKITNLIINLACKFVYTENSSFYGYPYFARENLILGNTIYSDSTIVNLLKEINQKNVTEFMEQWLKTHQTDKGMIISCDGTNVVTNSDDIELSGFGHNKNGASENQVSYTLLTDQNILRPLYLEEYNGSTHDIEAIKPILNWLKRIDVKNVNILVDRGYFSKNLMKKLLSQGYGFIMMVKTNNDIRNMIDLYENEIKSFSNYIPSLDLNGYTVARKAFKDVDKVIDYHIFHNKNFEIQCEKQLKIKIKNYCNSLKEKLNETLDEIEIEQYTKYFKLNIVNGILNDFEIDENAINDELKYSGYFVICTSFSLEAESAYYMYHNRDYTEKLIRMMKTNEQFDVCRVHSDESLISKNLAMFIGLILRSELFVRTKALREKTKDKKMYTTSHVIKELSCIQAVKESSGKYYNLRALTKQQKTILEALNVTEKELNNTLNKFNSNF